jgi:anti-sigma factor RsiW
MTDYMEGALARDARKRFDRHLATCDSCSAYLGQLRAIVAVLGRLRVDETPTPARDQLVELYRRFHAG